ncbi:ABC transporter ATP-binding protein/permease [Microbacterium halophytorum]|uniref:ABC transporter ATP-binding protein/permease n=1 Tax=Microbacterium halophytorum TaxID=2067568 RepID=UPI000CFA85E3|nr:ATP-binding cassette domain-containing protein [Microbacterium halophytorum]
MTQEARGAEVPTGGGGGAGAERRRTAPAGADPAGTDAVRHNAAAPAASEHSDRAGADDGAGNDLPPTGLDGSAAAPNDEDRPARPDLGPVPPIRLFVLGVLAALKALGLVLVAEAIARGIAGAASGSIDVLAVVALGIAGGLLRAGAGWASQVAARRIASGVKAVLRARLWRRIADGGAGRHGGVSVLAGEGLDDLDDYYTQSLPAMIAAVAVPAIAGLRILGADWVSALIVVLTVPLVPVFMILIGKHTQAATDEATGALTRLADHLTELARGLPVLVGLGRVEDQTKALQGIQREYRTRTMTTLRTAFMSALALELIATLSVALVAVFLGLRLMNGTVTLEAALVALILAPEIYGALREVGTAFHASQAGVAALARVKALLGRPAAPDVRVVMPATPTDAGAAHGHQVGVSLTDLTIRYAGRGRPVVDRLSVELTGITALTGPSGCGKSTVLAALAGVLPDDAAVTGAIRIDECGHNAVDSHAARVDPSAIPGADAHRGRGPTAFCSGDPARAAFGTDSGRGPGVAWAPQAPHGFAATPRDELALYGAGDPDAALAELALAHVADSAVAEISPGELRRLSVARALAQVDAGATLLVLDEPTAHLDAASADLVRAAIMRRAARTTIVIASHEPETVALADRRIAIGAPATPDAAGAAGADPGAPEARALPAAPASTAATADGAGVHPDPAADSDTAHRAGDARPGSPGAPAPDAGGLLPLIRPQRWRWLGAVALGLIATALGLSLTAVSGWLIVRASVEEHIMYLMVAIVGVRFFGLGRSVARYAERLATHSAAFRAIDGLRVRMWRSIAARGAGSRRLLEGGAPVDYLVTQADELRDQLPRVFPPIAVGVLAIVGVTITTWFVAPQLTAIVGLTLSAAAALGAVLAVAAERGAGAAGVAERAAIVRGTASLAAAADDLRGNSAPGSPPAPDGIAPLSTNGASNADNGTDRPADQGAREATGTAAPHLPAANAPRAAHAADGIAPLSTNGASNADSGTDSHANPFEEGGAGAPASRAHALDPRSAALARLDAVAARLARAERRAARGAGLGSAIAVLATSFLAALVSPLAFAAGVGAEQISVIALLCLAAFEPVGAIVQAAQRAPGQAAAIRRIDPILEPVPAALTGAGRVTPPVRCLELDDLAAAYPATTAYGRGERTGARVGETLGADETTRDDRSAVGAPTVASAAPAPASATMPAADTAERMVFRHVSAEVDRGEWLVVEGPSGSGKTTLLSILMGSLRPAAGEVRANGTPLPALAPDGWRERVAWCPQEAHVFDSTLRGNLLLARGADDAPTDEEMRGALRRAGLGTLLLSLADGLAARVGPAGTALSGGERQRLAIARALLSRADVLLLDEPTAHLDAPTAADMMDDIRSASADRITVLVSHRADDHREGDRTVSLAAADAFTAAR